MIKDHVIEREEHFVFNEKKYFFAKRVFCQYIDYSYIEGTEAAEKIKNIYTFVDPSPFHKKNIYLDTRFSCSSGNVVFYDTCHTRNYEEITEDGLKYFYGDICGNISEPEIIKHLRENNKPCKLHKTTVSTEGKVVALEFLVKKEDLVSCDINFDGLLDLVEVVGSCEHITASWILKYDLDAKSMWIGFSDNISPESYVEEFYMPQYYSVDWMQVKKDLYYNLVEKNIITKKQYDYMMSVTKGKQPTITLFLLNGGNIDQIYFSNMVTFKFEEID